MRKNLTAHLALLGANLFFGGGYSVAKTIMPRLIDPLGFIFMRVSVTTFLFWILAVFSFRRSRTIDKKDWKILVLSGFFGVALNQMLFFIGLNETSPIHASIIMLSTPILIMLMSAMALKERLTNSKVFGLILGVAGAILLVTHQSKASTVVSSSLKGDLIIMLNAFSYAIYLVLTKPLMDKYNPLLIIRWVFLFGFLFVLPFTFTPALHIKWALFSTLDGWALGFIVIGCTFLTYLWTAFALKKLTPATSGAYIYLQPIFAAIISIIVMNERLTFLKISAAILVFLGVFLVNYGGFNKKKGHSKIVSPLT